MPIYKILPPMELIHGTSASANTPFQESIIGIDKTNPQCADYIINNRTYATHSKLFGLMVRTPPLQQIQKGFTAEFYIDNTTLGQSANNLSFQLTLNSDWSGAIMLPPSEMQKIGVGVWDCYGTITSLASQPVQTIYVTQSRLVQVTSP